VRDKWETSGVTNWRQVGDKWGDNRETIGRQVGDKWEASGWKTSGRRQVGDKSRQVGTSGEDKWETSGRKVWLSGGVGDKWERRFQGSKVPGTNPRMEKSGYHPPSSRD
jgi:hypothetical protein